MPDISHVGNLWLSDFSILQLWCISPIVPFCWQFLWFHFTRVSIFLGNFTPRNSWRPRWKLRPLREVLHMFCQLPGGTTHLEVTLNAILHLNFNLNMQITTNVHERLMLTMISQGQIHFPSTQCQSKSRLFHTLLPSALWPYLSFFLTWRIEPINTLGFARSSIRAPTFLSFLHNVPSLIIRMTMYHSRYI